MSRRAQADIVGPARDGEVEVGERVTVLDLVTAEAVDYRIVADHDDREAVRMLATGSPLAAALVGRHVGDVVEVELDGRAVRLEIVEIDG